MFLQVADCSASAVLSVGEFPAHFAQNILNDVTAEEGTRAFFTVDLSQLGGHVEWFVDGKSVIKDPRYQEVAAGTSRTLAIIDCQRGVDDKVSSFRCPSRFTNFS